MKKSRILFGISGIGNGHTNRQLPLIEYFSKTSLVTIFAYDDSYNFFSNHFKNTPSVRIERVAVPFFAGTNTGLDFRATINHPDNQNKDFFRINSDVLDRTMRNFGKPNLVISDYEPTVAQYAYAYNAPFVTIDQQSKYLCGDFPKKLGGFTFEDEIVRLHMFFPKAAARIACSFFDVPRKKDGDTVKIVPPILKNQVVTLKRSPKTSRPSLLIYISSAREFVQDLKDLLPIFQSQNQAEFHLFVRPSEVETLKIPQNEMIHVYPHGSPAFKEVLATCSGIVSTAGHSLLSEAMYLGIPVYAIPVSPYEQHMNAYVIGKYGFGISFPRLSKGKLAEFIEHLPTFSENIKKDKKVLVRGVGQNQIIKYLEKEFLGV